MIPVEGGEVWAEDTGGDGPVLLMLHPGIGDSRLWDPLMPALTKDHRVVRYDSRGYGRSPAATQEFTLLDDCVAVLDHLGIEQSAVVGCSQGGGVGMGLAIAHPQRVRALVLVCPGIPGFAWDDDPQLDAEMEAAADEGAEALAKLGLRLWAAAGETPDAVEQMRSASLAWISSAPLQRDDPPVFDRLGEISVPASILVGDLDRADLIESNRQAAQRIPGCAYIEVPGVDHLPPLRVPELVLRQIADTLARL